MNIPQTIDRTEVLRMVMRMLIDFHCSVSNDGIPGYIAEQLLRDAIHAFRKNSKPWGYTEGEVVAMSRAVQVEHLCQHHGASLEEANRMMDQNNIGSSTATRDVAGDATLN